MKRMVQLQLLALALVVLLCGAAAAEEWIPTDVETTQEVVPEWNEPDSALLVMAREDGLIHFEDIDEPLQEFLQTNARCIFDTLRPSKLMERLAWVTEADLSGCAGTLRDARWLYMFTGLTSLAVSDAAFADLNVIGTLTTLESLKLTNCGVFSLVPLENCRHLEALTLGWDADYTGETGAFDLAPLSTLKSLKSLSLYGSGIRSLAPLSATAKNVRELTLSDTAIDDVSLVKSMTRLDVLTLDLLNSAVVTDILSICTRDIDELTLSRIIFDSEVEAAAKKFKSLTNYTLADCDVSNAQFYEGLNKAAYLTLRNITLSDGSTVGEVYADKKAMILDHAPDAVMIEMLAKRSQSLATLTLGIDALSDDLSAALRRRTSINNLTVHLYADCDLSGDLWSRISGIRDLTIASKGRTLASTDFLGDLTSLSALTLSGMKVDNTAGIGTLKRVTELNVYGCQIGDWSFLTGLQTLNTVKIYGCGLTSDTLPLLTELKKLTDLRLDGNQLTDISALRNADTVQKLDLLNNPIEDYAVLRDMPAMDTVYVDKGSIIITDNYILARSVYIDDVDYEAIYADAFGTEAAGE